MTRAPRRRAHAAHRRSPATTRSFRTDVSCPRTPISSWRSHLRPAPATRANSGRSLADAEQTIRGFFVASSLLVSTVSVVPYFRARENAPSLTQRFVSAPHEAYRNSCLSAASTSRRTSTSCACRTGPRGRTSKWRYGGSVKIKVMKHIGRSTQVKGMKEIIDLAKAGRLPPLDEPPPTA